MKLSDDVASLTSFNPFSEDDDNDKSSYTLVTSIFSRMKNTLSAPLASTTPAAVPSTAGTNVPAPLNLEDQRRLSHPGQSQVSAPVTKTPGSERRNPLHPAVASAAPPLVSLTPAQSEVLSYNAEYERSPSRGAFYSPVWDSSEGALFGTSIPGFPIPDDARSIRTSASFHRSASVSKVIRRLRGEGEHPYPVIRGWFAQYSQGYQDITGWKMRIVKNAMTVKVYSPHGDENTIAEYVVSNAKRKKIMCFNDWNRPDLLFAMCFKRYKRFSFRAGRDGPRL